MILRCGLCSRNAYDWTARLAAIAAAAELLETLTMRPEADRFNERQHRLDDGERAKKIGVERASDGFETGHAR
jgi:hypothetical protein